MKTLKLKGNWWVFFTARSFQIYAYVEQEGMPDEKANNKTHSQSDGSNW
jgi:hypothetical protein